MLHKYLTREVFKAIVIGTLGFTKSANNVANTNGPNHLIFRDVVRPMRFSNITVEAVEDRLVLAFSYTNGCSHIVFEHIVEPIFRAT